MTQILVIEDNPANLELMVYLLTAFGYEPLSATEGESGLALIHQTRPSLILCDVQLPGIDGYAIAQQLKSSADLSTIPLVAVTALAMVGDRDHILASGFDGYISKPIIPETFINQVEAFLTPELRALQAPQAAEITSPAPPGPPVAHRATILSVDDFAPNQELLKSILEPFGYAVLCAQSVAEAISLAQTQQPELVMSDLHMPGQSGYDLIREFKADPALRDIKIIIHSATIRSDQHRLDVLEMGATKFITRPIDPQVILNEIAACINDQPERQDGEDPGA